MVVLTIFAIIGIASVFLVGYWIISTKFPKAGDKINKFVGDVGSSLKKKKDSETVEDLNKLDK